jgi:hypothetical protein
MDGEWGTKRGKRWRKMGGAKKQRKPTFIGEIASPLNWMLDLEPGVCSERQHLI